MQSSTWFVILMQRKDTYIWLQGVSCKFEKFCGILELAYILTSFDLSFQRDQFCLCLEDSHIYQSKRNRVTTKQTVALTYSFPFGAAFAPNSDSISAKRPLIACSLITSALSFFDISVQFILSSDSWSKWEGQGEELNILRPNEKEKVRNSIS